MADDWKSRGEKELSKALEDLYSRPPPPSVSKIDPICRIAVAPRNMKFYKYVVHQIIKHNRNAPTDYRILLLYIIDAVCKVTRTQSAVYAERFGKEVDAFLEDLRGLPRSDWEKAQRIFRLWVESDLLPREALGKIDRACQKKIEQSIFDPLPNEPANPGGLPVAPPNSGWKDAPSLPPPAAGHQPAPHYGRPQSMEPASMISHNYSDSDDDGDAVRVNYSTEPRAGDANLNYTLPTANYGGPSAQTDSYNATYGNFTGVAAPPTGSFVPPTLSAADFANVVKMAALWQQAQALGQSQGALPPNTGFPPSANAPAFFPPPQGEFPAPNRAAPYPEEYRGPSGAPAREPVNRNGSTREQVSYNSNEFRSSDSRAASSHDPRESHRRSDDQRTDPRSGDGFRNGPRNESRNDPRNGPRNDPRNDPRGDPRSESRGDPRDPRASDPRNGARNDPRSDSRTDPRGDHRGDPRQDPRGGSQSTSRRDPRDPRGDPRGNDYRGGDPRRSPHNQRGDPRNRRSNFVSPPETSRAVRGRDSGDPWYYEHPITVKSTALYVGGVPRSVSERELRGIFEEFGEIRSVGIHGTGGFIQFTFREDAESARDHFQTRELFGRFMKFGWALNPLMIRESLDKKKGVGQMPPEVLCPEMLDDIRQRGLIIDDPNPPAKPEGVYNSHAPDRPASKRDREWETDRHAKRPHY